MKTALKFSLFSIALSLLTGAASARCINDTTAEPSLPNGEAASLEDMLLAQEKVKRHVETWELLLETCHIDTMRHNYAVDRITRLADDYNLQLKLYRSKLASR